jgi:hypothetical protein
MSEPDVTLTDYGLAFECAILTILLAFAPASQRAWRLAGIGFFVFLGLAAATGGTVHGFCPDRQTPACQLLWELTLQLVGLAAFSTWILGAGIIANGRGGRWLTLAAVPQIAIYSPIALLVTQEFWIALTIYLPAALLLLAGFVTVFQRDGDRYGRIGASGSLLSLVSSLIQFLGIGIDPVYFNHNALAHVVQGAALFLIFLAVRHLTGPDYFRMRVARETDMSPQ